MRETGERTRRKDCDLTGERTKHKECYLTGGKNNNTQDIRNVTSREKEQDMRNVTFSRRPGQEEVYLMLTLIAMETTPPSAAVTSHKQS